ncbi:MAG: saccharopine dehydrogenase NADP-binding domain-containing protein [Deltaproteobacteria bacterium]|nr:saccharopine dehydrogenase NADP-binding domain-containing protein [Deltaproteobacteria bacterium]
MTNKNNDKNILLLGAGLVAGPMARYLLKQPNINLTVADEFIDKAEKLTDNRPNSRAITLNVKDKEALNKEVAASDIVVSLLPWTLHPIVAKLCLEHKKHLVTASYVKEEMQSFDSEAKEKGLIFLNEIGVDPGLDHMAAMKVINSVKKAGGEITSFYSYCGGLPSLESNTNPMGYKFSWNPEGAMLAANNDGQYLKDGQIIKVSSKELFRHYWFLEIPNIGVFEAYVNRDSVPYLDIYNIKNAKSIYRGTLRNPGHCETWDCLKRLNLLDSNKKFDLSAMSPYEVITDIINGSASDLKKDLAAFLGVVDHSVIIKKIEWLGLLSKEKLPLASGTAFDMFAHILKQKLSAQKDDTDLLVQHHEFIAEYPNKKEQIASTLSAIGIKGGDSAMARTVGLPAAIGVKLIAENKIDLTGVHIPVLPQIYEPVLNELETMDIKFTETKKKIV